MRQLYLKWKSFLYLTRWSLTRQRTRKTAPLLRVSALKKTSLPLTLRRGGANSSVDPSLEQCCKVCNERDGTVISAPAYYVGGDLCLKKAIFLTPALWENLTTSKYTYIQSSPTVYYEVRNLSLVTRVTNDKLY